jgi:hypothetical protein
MPTEVGSWVVELELFSMARAWGEAWALEGLIELAMQEKEGKGTPF